MSYGIIRVLGVVLFLYLTWRNAREDFKDENLVTMSWLALLSFLVGGRIAFGLLNWGVWNESGWDWFLFWEKPGFNFLGAYLSFTAAIIWYASRQGWKVWALLEDMVNSTLILFSMYFLDETMRSRFDLESLTYALVLLIGFGVANLIKNRYRSYFWYRSGKKGFVYFFTNIVVFLLFLGLSFWFNEGKLVMVSFGIMSLISFISLFILGDVLAPLSINFNKKKNK